MRIDIDERILGGNDELAAASRARLAELGVLAVNMLSAPGSGKTTLLERTVVDLMARGVRPAVIEGDVATTNDADRIARYGVPALQITTERLSATCHLDARMVGQALDRLPLGDVDLIVIENVGNLVCPAAFDLGEDARAAVLSVTEGEDKPLKYPRLFREADIVLVNKVDLAPYVECDLALIESNLRQVQPALEVLFVSAKTGEGCDAWVDWLVARVAAKRGRA
jgi:hydrogenase nickel incorporation protein HypB